MNKKQYIGLAGVSRSGKNSFADIMIELYREKNIVAKQFALAYHLKRECEQFIQEKLGYSVWSEKTEEKTIFRDFLVWFGDVKRKQTNGRHWIELLKKDLENSTAQINIVTDIRYSVYINDELEWIKHDMGGTLIHISKYNMVNGDILYTPPANEHEKINDPKLKEMSDIIVSWPDKSSLTYMELLRDVSIRTIVGDTISKIKKL